MSWQVFDSNGVPKVTGGAVTIAGTGAFTGGVSTAGNTAGSTGTVNSQIVFVGSNNITLSQSTAAGGSATISIFGGAGGGGSVNFSAGTTSNNLTNVVFSNSNGVSFGLNGSTITASAAGAAANLTVQDSATTLSVSKLVFTNSNGLTATLSTAAGVATVIMSHNGLTSQTNQQMTMYATGNTTQSSTGTTNASSVIFRGSNLVSVGITNGSVLIDATQTTPVVSNAIQSVGSATGSGTNTSRFAADDHVHAGVFSVGVSTAGNTSGDTRVDVGRFVFQGGNNVTLSQVTAANALNTIIISGANAGGAQTGISGIANSETTYTSGTVYLSERANITINSSVNGASQYYRFSVSNQSADTGGIYNSSQTTGQSSSSTYDIRSLSFVYSNNISGGWTNGSLLFNVTTAAQTNQTLSLAVSSNTVGNTSGMSVDARSLTIRGDGGASVGISTSAGGSSLIISAPVSATTVSGVTSGNVVGTRGTRFALEDHQHEGVYSVGVSTGGNTSGDTAVRPGRLVLAGGNNITLSGATAAGSLQTITISAAAQTNQTLSWALTSNTTGNTSGMSVDARSLTLRGDGIASVGISTSAGGSSLIISATQSNQAFSAAGGSSAFQTLGFSDNSNASWTNTNGSVAIASIRASLYATSNTTQSSTGTTNLNSIIFAGAGAASVGITNGSIVISAPNAAAGNVTFSAGANSAGLASVVFSNSNNVSFGLNGSTITASAGGGGGGIGGGVSNLGNTAGSTGTVTTGNIVFVGTGPISLSQSTGAAGSNATISIDGPATSSLVGASGISISTNGSTITIYDDFQSYYRNLPAWHSSATIMSASGSSSQIFPFEVDNNVSINYMRVPASMSVQSTSFASTGNTSYSVNYQETHRFVYYTRGVGASSLSLQSYTSTSASFRHSAQLSRNTTNNISVSNTLTFYGSGGTTSTTFSYAATNSSDQWSTTQLSNFTGFRWLDLPLSTTFGHGQFWLMFGISTAITTQQTVNISNYKVFIHDFPVATQANLTAQEIGSASNSSNQIIPGIGLFSTAGGGTTNSLPLSAISSIQSHPILFLQLSRI